MLFRSLIYKLQQTWKIHPSERAKNMVTKQMNVAWKGFKTELVNRYVKSGEMPFDEYPWIEQEDWDEFVRMKTSEPFRV